MAATSGVKVLQKVQFGREVTPGTPVACTTVHRGPGLTPNDERSIVLPDENVGYSSRVTRAYTPMLKATMELPEVEATFEQVNHAYEAGIKVVTPAADGSGSDKIYAYPLPSGDSNTIKTYTLRGGNQKTVEVVEYAVVEEITLSGKRNEAIKQSSKWFGRQAVVDAFSGGATIPTVEEMLFNKTTLAIDNVGGTLGATLIANSFIDFKLVIKTGYKAQFTGEGNLYFSFADFIGAKATLDLTLLHNAATAAERVLWRANTPRQIQILTKGAALGTPGTTYTYKTHKIDIAGNYTEFKAPNEDDEGSNVYKVKFEGGYDATAALFCNLTVVNELASVP